MPCRIAAAGALLFFALFASHPSDARAQVEKGSFGLGLIVGEPSGLSAKLYLADDTAVDFAIGASLIEGGLTVHSDFLWHPFVILNETQFVLPVYFGPGARIVDRRGDGNDDDLLLGVRGVGGILFDFRQLPLDVFAEFALIVDLVVSDGGNDDSAAELNVGLAAGVRYYF